MKKIQQLLQLDSAKASRVKQMLYLVYASTTENRPYQPRLAKGQLSLTSLNDQVYWQFSDEKWGN